MTTPIGMIADIDMLVLAGAAAGGEWRHEAETSYSVEQHRVRAATGRVVAEVQYAEDAAFIAATPPMYVRDLIARANIAESRAAANGPERRAKMLVLVARGLMAIGLDITSPNVETELERLADELEKRRAGS